MNKLLFSPLFLVLYFVLAPLPQALFGTCVRAQTVTPKAALYQTYLAGDGASAQALVDRFVADESVPKIQLLESYYLLLNSTMATQDKATFEANIGTAEKLAEQLAKAKGDDAPRAQGILAALYGYKIAYAPAKGMTLGPKSKKLYAQALAANPDEPLVLMLYGVNKYHTPAAWGGSLTEAEKSMQQALATFSCGDDEWVHASALAWLGMAQHDLEKQDEALKTFELAASTHKGFNWVDKVLLPQAREIAAERKAKG